MGYVGFKPHCSRHAYCKKKITILSGNFFKLTIICCQAYTQAPHDESHRPATLFITHKRSNFLILAIISLKPRCSCYCPDSSVEKRLKANTK